MSTVYIPELSSDTSTLLLYEQLYNSMCVLARTYSIQRWSLNVAIVVSDSSSRELISENGASPDIWNHTVLPAADTDELRVRFLTPARKTDTRFIHQL